MNDTVNFALRREHDLLIYELVVHVNKVSAVPSVGCSAPIQGL